MSSSAVGCVNHIMDEYKRFLKSAYRLADPHLREQFEKHINESDVLVKGPYVTLSRDFKKGKSLDMLTVGGIGHKYLTKLNWPFGTNPLYMHQEKTFLNVERDGRNCIVTTGTGSGKTEAFLLPVISGILNLKEKIKGTKAIIIYPMNSLANDQLVRLRDLVRDSNLSLTFALYTGDSESVSSILGDPLPGNEIVSRKKIRENPPDIILTNYKQLEFMLLRRSDRAIFTNALKFLVLDEIHSYRGALATEIACLIRRLKSRCSLKEGELRCIGTSATVSEGAGGEQSLAKFVSDLFGENFKKQDMQGEETVPRAIVSTYDPPAVKIRGDELLDFNIDDEELSLALAKRITGKSPSANGALSAKIFSMFSGNRVVTILEEECSQPHSFTELIGIIKDKYPAIAVLSDQEIRTLIETYLLLGSIGTKKDLPILRPKLHSFFHGVYDVGLCMNPACRTLVKDGSEQCPECLGAVRPAALCRTCGQDFVKVKFTNKFKKPPMPNEDFISDENTGFITPFLQAEKEDSEEDEDEVEKASGSKKKVKTARDKLVEYWVCHACGMVHDLEIKPVMCNHCGDTKSLSLQKIMMGKGSTCPACNSTYPKGDILTLLRSGVSSTNSILATHHMSKLNGDDRKLIIFADNRQEAAHQAGFMGDRHRQFALRHALVNLLKAHPEGITIKDLSEYVLTKYQEIGLADKRLTQDERKKWIKTLELEVAGEFCRSSHMRVSLEHLGLAEIKYEFLDEVFEDPRFSEICKEADISEEDAHVAVRAILDKMRRSRAVSFDFFQKYLDLEKQPYSMLTEEPWSLSVPERERQPNLFMMDRSEEARNSPSGFKINGIVKDTDHGGGAVVKIAKKSGVGVIYIDKWLKKIFELLRDKEILEAPEFLPPKVRNAIGSGKPLQISVKVLKAFYAKSGYRCSYCQSWHPYKSKVCLSSKCIGTGNDIKECTVDNENYYVRFYASQSPQRMKTREHTAQISEEKRAERESDFKTGKIDILVCSPTLELGVNIGQLLTVMMRNCPPTPANYIQRAGRAGRDLRIGFVSTFCGMGPHDRHCFEEPQWLVRGQFFPPIVRMDNGPVVSRHIRSFVLESVSEHFPEFLVSFIDNPAKPDKLKMECMEPLFSEIKINADNILKGAAATFSNFGNTDLGFIRNTISEMPGEIERIIRNWFQQINRIFKEFEEYNKITADKRAKQKAAARQRAYIELTIDKQSAYVLNYLSNEGLLPSYQFPTDTFSLEPGVSDTPTLRRPAWIALFEFAPGNLVYANSHKLKSIRAYFEGQNKAAASGGSSLDSSGRVRSFYFCTKCGFATEEVRNQCAECGEALGDGVNAAFIESFEAEQSMQITASEEARERANFERKESLITEGDTTFIIYPYPFTQLELCHKGKILVTNWGRRNLGAAEGERFDLCQVCGRHRPSNLNETKRHKWDEEHAKRCAGQVSPYILGYEFKADALILPVADRFMEGNSEDNAFVRTLGTSLISGAVELIEIESDEIAFFSHKLPHGGKEIVFYETVPGGAGYLESLAKRLPEWADAALKRLFTHECSKACYRCLKSYRNQPFHRDLDKGLINNFLFQLSCTELGGDPFKAKRRDGIKLTNDWIHSICKEQPTKDTVIEKRLAEIIMQKGRLPKPSAQREFKTDSGVLLTIADFAYEEEKIAIYCDGYAFHGNKDTLALDAQKRNAVQAQGWSVLTFWGKTILKYPERCEEQIWRVYKYKKC